jgi:hypothetical protein
MGKHNYRDFYHITECEIDLYLAGVDVDYDYKMEREIEDFLASVGDDIDTTREHYERVFEKYRNCESGEF